MQNVAAATRLLTAGDLMTLGGATLAVTVIANGLHYAWGLTPRITALAASFLVAVTGVLLSGDLALSAWLISVPNAFVIYCTAVGLSVMTGKLGAEEPGGGDTEEIAPNRRFWSPWY